MKEIRNEKMKQDLIENAGYKERFTFDPVPQTRLFRFNAGDYIVREGKPPAYLFYLAKGRSKLYTTLANGRVSLIDFLDSPCFIGEMELVDESHRPRDVQAIEECWCLALPMKQFRSQLLNDVVFLRYLCVAFSRKNYRNIVSSSQNQSFPLANRLATFILLTQNEGVYCEKHTQAAEYMGVSYRHLLYVIAQFTRDGILTKEKSGYVVSDRKALVALALEMEPDRNFTG